MSHREALDRYVERMGSIEKGELDARALAAIGRFASGRHNVSIEHDRYLDEDFSS